MFSLSVIALVGMRKTEDILCSLCSLSFFILFINGSIQASFVYFHPFHIIFQLQIEKSW